jgi:hypothetical protein
MQAHLKSRHNWRRVVVGAVAAWLAVALELPAQTEAKRYAILVGVNQYQHARVSALSYAVNDVTDLAQVLENAGYEVRLLCDTTGKRDPQLAPTKENIEKQVKTTLQKCRKGDSVLVAFAGHGLQFDGQKDSYFCPSDARPFADRTDSLVSLKRIYEELDASFASVKIMLVDACRNDPRGGRGTRGLDADSAPRPPRGVAALFSCSAGQTAYEDDRLKHGVFFHFVLQGLRGEAKDRDGEVTFDGLSAYVRKQVAREVPKMYGEDSQQSPNLKADLSGESPVLVRLKAGGAEFKTLPEKSRQTHGPGSNDADRAGEVSPRQTIVSSDKQSTFRAEGQELIKTDSGGRGAKDAQIWRVRLGDADGSEIRDILLRSDDKGLFVLTDRNLLLFDSTTGKELFRTNAAKGVMMSLSSSSSEVAVTTKDGKTLRYDSKTGRPLK